jgi:hypothetical protein
VTPIRVSPARVGEIADLLKSAEMGTGLSSSIRELIKKMSADSGKPNSSPPQTGGLSLAFPLAPPGMADKVLYLSVPRGAIERATTAPQFILDTQIADLNLKLSQIRQCTIEGETLKLQRLIEKRSEMFDMLRQIIDKYNATARNITQSMGR